MQKPKRRLFKIIDVDDSRHPYGLVGPDDTVIRVDTNPRALARWAFDVHGEEIEVRHDEDLVKAESVF